MAWRTGWLVSLLVMGVGCGGPLPGEEDEPPASSEDLLTPRDAQCSLPSSDSTKRVKTILPPSQIGIPRFAEAPNGFVKFKGQLYFAVNFEDGQRALWKSNGTEAGTTHIQGFPATDGRFTRPLASLAAGPTRLFFQVPDLTHGNELWVSDGTTAGTRLVKDLTPGTVGSTLSHLTALGDRLVFFKEIYDSATVQTRYELWTSDGTAAGTARIRDFGWGREVSVKDAAEGGALRFFVLGPDGVGTVLWKTDGTPAGSIPVKTLTSSEDAFIWDIQTRDSVSLFVMREHTGLQELWKSDGMSSGTVRLASFGPTRVARLVGRLGSWVYVAVTSLSSQYMVLYRVPLSGGNPTPVVSLPNDYASLGEAFPSIEETSSVPGGTKLYFSVSIGSEGPAPRDTQLWVTDGSAAGTLLLRRPLSLSDEYRSPVVAVQDDLVFFSAFEGETLGIEPWVSDGTPEKTRKLKDISHTGVTGSSYPRDFFRLGSRVYFSAYDDTLAGQLWSTVLRCTGETP
ncbi:ELWxxDGT repeat protein [Myxococcus stipitatus]|uniref:ELWxxDGT repeat protein n=1 Tax=Myxococcus stipitatus TaxID=83455 RepID=UPI0030D24EAF